MGLDMAGARSGQWLGEKEELHVCQLWVMNLVLESGISKCSTGEEDAASQ